jgi:hypothetical protein
MYQKSKIRAQSVNHATDWVHLSIQMGEFMSVNSKKEVSMDEASIPGRMDVFTLENSKTAKGMVREPLLGQREKLRVDFGRTANW